MTAALGHFPSRHVLQRLARPSFSTTSVRWKRREPLRKNIWLPMAPSKRFQIPEMQSLPRDEQLQVDHWKFNYDSDLFSIASYCRDNFYLPSREAGGLTPEQVHAEEEQHRRRLEENDQENKRIAADRQKRLDAQKQKLQQDLVQQELQQKQQQELERIQAEQLVRQEIERSATYITKDSLLSAIENALLHPVTYDFAIDKNGNVITDGKIHVQAFTPSAVPQAADNHNTMIDATDVRLKPAKLY